MLLHEIQSQAYFCQFQFALHQNSSSCVQKTIYERNKSCFFFFFHFFLTEGLKNRQSVSAGSREKTNMHACVEDRWRENNGQENCFREKKKKQKSRMIQTNGHWVYELACIAGEKRKELRERACTHSCVCVCVFVTMKRKCQANGKHKFVCRCVCTGVCVCACRRERERERKR